MQARSARFDDATKYGGQAIAIVDVYRSGVLQLANIPLESGKVAVDISAAQHRSLDVVVVDDIGILTPKIATDPLMPYNGNELLVRSGFQFPDGSQDLVSLGMFRIDEVSVESKGTVHVTGMDRSIVIQEARFEAPYTVLGGTSDVDAIKAIIDARVAGLDWTQWPTVGSYALPNTIYEEADRSGDPWKICQDIAANGGREVLFDPTGRPIIRPTSDPGITVVSWTYTPGVDNILTKSTKRNSSQGIRNVWVVIGESASVGGGNTPFRATAEITDINSPIFPSPSGFGRRPTFYASNLIATIGQAQAVADKMKADSAGISEIIGFSAIPHFAQEARDVVQVVDAETGINAFLVLTSFDIDIFSQSETTFGTVARRA